MGVLLTLLEWKSLWRMGKLVTAKISNRTQLPGVVNEQRKARQHHKCCHLLAHEVPLKMTMSQKEPSCPTDHEFRWKLHELVLGTAR